MRRLLFASLLAAMASLTAVAVTAGAQPPPPSATDAGAPDAGDVGLASALFQDGVGPQPSYQGTDDAVLGAKNEGTARKLHLTPAQSALLRFSLTLPPGARVGGAALTLSATKAQPGALELRALRRPWLEGEVTRTQPSKDARWQSPNASGDEDRTPEVLARAEVKGPGPLTLAFNEAGLAVLQHWLEAPEANVGFQLTASAPLTLHASEAKWASERPALSVRFTPAAPDAGGFPAPDAGVAHAAPDAGAVAVLVGAGDIATCDGDADEATARLVDQIPGAVFTLGDNAYSNGSPRDYEQCYAPTWGRHRARTRPVVGNHDFYSPRAAPYFAYFGQAAGTGPSGYYQYRAGEWLVVVLNSNCGEVPGGCGRDSPQARWLQRVLEQNPTRCTLAMWHHPLFSSGIHRSNDEVRPLFEILYEHDADLVLTGHDHDYERVMPVDPRGKPDPRRGLRQFVVGTGGVALRPFLFPSLGITELRDNSTHGVLELTLKPDGYAWRFIPVPGQRFTDSGSTPCH